MTVGQAMRFEGDVEDRDHVLDISAQIMEQIMSLAQERERRVTAVLAASNGYNFLADQVGAK